MMLLCVGVFVCQSRIETHFDLTVGHSHLTTIGDRSRESYFVADCRFGFGRSQRHVEHRRRAFSATRAQRSRRNGGHSTVANLQPTGRRRITARDDAALPLGAENRPRSAVAAGLQDRQAATEAAAP